MSYGIAANGASGDVREGTQNHFKDMLTLEKQVAALNSTIQP